MKKLTKQINCDFCGKDNARFFIDDEKEFGIIVQCRDCGFCYQNPRMIIPVDYSKWEEPGLDKSIVENAIREYGKVHLSERGAKERTFQTILDEICKYKKGGKILEVGSSFGFLLDMARRRGWDVSGIEPYTPAREWSQKNLGLTVLPTTVRESNFPDRHFDAILMINVLEHVDSPIVELEEINRILKPAGILYLEVPNIKNIWIKLLRKRWRFFLVEHYSYFSPETISKFLGETGYRVYDVHSSPRYVSMNFFVTKLRHNRYLCRSVCTVLEKMLNITKLGKIQLTIDLKDSMRVIAGKDRDGGKG